MHEPWMTFSGHPTKKRGILLSTFLPGIHEFVIHE